MDAEAQKVMAETLSHQKVPSLSKITQPLQNNTMKLLDKDPYYITTKEDEDENNENHSDAKQADNRSGDKFPPRWKNPSRMFKMEMKPAGSSIKFKCVPEGNVYIKMSIKSKYYDMMIFEPKIVYCYKH